MIHFAVMNYSRLCTTHRVRSADHVRHSEFETWNLALCTV